MHAERPAAGAGDLARLSCELANANLRASIESSRRNEAERESQVRPGSDYLARHPLDEKMRSIAISWLLEVVKACNLKHSTLFLAASYFDRFMSVSKVRRYSWTQRAVIFRTAGETSAMNQIRPPSPRPSPPLPPRMCLLR
jgi:hypothetical protein